MFHYIKEHFGPFWKGAAGSGVLWAPVLFSDLNSGLVAYLLRLTGAALIAFVSGLCTILATDFYNECKARIKKRKDARSKKEIEEGKRKERA